MCAYIYSFFFFFFFKKEKEKKACIPINGTLRPATRAVWEEGLTDSDRGAREGSYLHQVLVGPLGERLLLHSVPFICEETRRRRRLSAAWRHVP